MWRRLEWRAVLLVVQPVVVGRSTCLFTVVKNLFGASEGEKRRSNTVVLLDVYASLGESNDGSDSNEYGKWKIHTEEYFRSDCEFSAVRIVTGVIRYRS